MSRALLFLALSLARRRFTHLLLGLRRPTTAIGFGALAFFFGVCFHYRHAEFFGQLVRPESLVGGALLMICGSLFQGFLHRGLVFETADVDFLFTSPFTQRQILLYRLLPSYAFAFAQGLVFLVLFAPHLAGPQGTDWGRPVAMAAALMFFQVICFHISAGGALFAGKISETAHYRCRWMLLAGYAWITLIYLRVAWNVNLVPAKLLSPILQPLFYPAISLPDISAAPRLRDIALNWSRAGSLAAPTSGLVFMYPVLFAGAALLSLSFLLRLKGNILEGSLATTARFAEKRKRLIEGHGVVSLASVELPSAPFPKVKMFRGAGALIWRNLIMASRSKKQMLTGVAFAAVYIGFLVAIRWVLRREMSQGGLLPDREIREFDTGLAGMLCFLSFMLQRTFPFDFRRDGNHILTFRTLPVRPFALVIGQVVVPVTLCLACQAAGIVALLGFSQFDWLMLLFLLLAFPAITLALNSVWNLHYLITATRGASGRAGMTSPVAVLMVVVLSFLIFYPAGWLALEVGKHVRHGLDEPAAFATGLVVQYAVDFLLLAVMARLFQNFEVPRES